MSRTEYPTNLPKGRLFVAQKQHYAVLPAECLRAKGAEGDRHFVGGKLMSAPFALGAKTENCVCGWAAVTGLNS